MSNIIVRGKRDFCEWLYNIFEDKGIICARDLTFNSSVLDIGGKEVNLQVLYELDLFPRLMYIYNNISDDISDVEGFVIGSSVGRDSIDVKMLSKPFVMLANSAQDFFYDRCSYDKYINHVNKLKYVIHAWTTFSLRYDESLSRTKQDNVLFYYPIYGTLHNSTCLDDRIKQYNIEKEKFDRCFKGIFTWDEVRKELWNHFFLYSGWNDPILIDTCFDRNNVPQIEIDMAVSQNNKPYPLTIKENIEIILDMYEDMHKRGIKALIYLQPMSEVYKQYWDIKYYEEVSRFAKYISQKYQCDFLDLSMFNLPDNYYRDLIHMNNRGKEYITNIIDEIVSGY